MARRESSSRGRARQSVAVLATLGVLGALGVLPAPSASGESPPAAGPGATTVAPATTAPPATTTPPATTVPPPSPPIAPDVVVRRLPGHRPVGAGPPTSVTPTTTTVARVGQQVFFEFRVSHTGDAPAGLWLRARGGERGTSVTWRLHGRNVTPSLGGAGRRVNVPAGGSVALTMRATIGPALPAGLSLVRTLTARAEDGSADRAAAVVSRPRTVRLHDVGGALGLPRVTNSFDFATGPLDGDGVDDLVMSTHGRVRFYLNRQAGLEQIFDISGGDLHGCDLGDVNADDRSDVYCGRGAQHGTVSKRNSLWIQQPDGTFNPGQNRAAAYGLLDPYGRAREVVFTDLDHRNGPDIFLGNEHFRQDGKPSINHTFVDDGGTGFTDADLRMQADVGALCAQAFDQDRNGWQDLLVCGGAGRATVGADPADNRLHLFRNLRRENRPGRRLVDVAPRLGIDTSGVVSARLAHLNGDRLADLVIVTSGWFAILRGLPGGRFGPSVFTRGLQAGRSVAVADLDGRLGLDVYIVQSCRSNGGVTTNVDDLLYLNAGRGWAWTQAELPRDVRGCGDTAEPLDVDGDGVDDLLVGNGFWGARGPIQVLTSGRYWG